MAKRKKNKRTRPKPSSADRQPPAAIEPDLLQRARAISAAGRYADAAVVWHRLGQAHPRQSEPAFRLAHALWQLGRVYEAREATRRGLKNTPATPDGWCRAAKLLALVDGYADAADLLRQAVLAAPDRSEAWKLLATALERLNQTDPARDAAARALALDPADAQARLIYARLLRRSAQAEDAAHALDRLGRDPSLEPGIRTSVHYEHAAALDACGRYDEAWEACGRAKALLLPHADPYRPAAQRAIKTLQHLANHLTQDDYARWAEQKLDPLPFKLAFLVGHPRSGTTLVEKQLAQATGALDIDEQPFLDAALGQLFTDKASNPDPAQRLRSATRSELQEVRRGYTAMLAEFAETDLVGRAVLDKHPEMIRYLPYLVRVFPEASIIIVNRDMRDVILSCYMLPVPLGPVTVDYLEVETAADRYRAIMASYETIKQKLVTPPVEVAYEPFVAQPQAWLEHLVEALGFAGTLPTRKSDDAAVYARSPSYAAVSVAPRTNRIERWRNYRAISLVAPYSPKHSPSQADQVSDSFQSRH